MVTPAAGLSDRKIVQELRASGLSVADIACTTDVPEDEVRNWADKGTQPPSNPHDRLVAMHGLVRSLSEVYQSEGVEIWLHASNPELNHARPLDLLAGGAFQPVVQAVERLRSGAT